MRMKITPLAVIVLIIVFGSLIGSIGYNCLKQPPVSQEGGRTIWTKEDYANHFIDERMLEITQTKEKFEEALKDEGSWERLVLWFSHKNKFVLKNYKQIQENKQRLSKDEIGRAEAVYQDYKNAKSTLITSWREKENIYWAMLDYIQSLKEFIYLLQDLNAKYLLPKYEEYIEKYRPSQYSPMEFGAVANTLFIQTIDRHSKEEVLKEIECFLRVGVDYIRIDISDKKSYSQNDWEKIELAAQRIREGGKKLWMMPFGRYGLSRPLTISEWQKMIQNQLREMNLLKLNPEYIEVAAEPFSLWERFNMVEKTDPDIWLNAIENTAKKAREIFPNSKIVVGIAGYEVERKLKTDEPFAAGLFKINEIDIIGLNYYEGSGTGGFETTFGDLLDNYWPGSGKQVWIAETWWDGATSPGTYYDNLAEKHIISVTYWAQYRRLSGVALFYTSHLYTADDYEPTPAFYTYSSVIEGVRENAK